MPWIGECFSQLLRGDRVALIERCPKLVHLSLKLIAIGDAVIRSLCEHCPKLQYFAVGRQVFNVRDTPGSLRVTSSALSLLATRCPLLRTLDLSDCCDIDSALKTIAQNCPQLRKLIVTGLSNVSEGTMILLSERCPLLEHLDAEFCERCSERALISLAEKCHKLVYLNISFWRGVTNTGLLSVARNCPQMLSFTCNSLGERVTIDALLEISRSCPLLVKLMCFSAKPSTRLIESVLVNNPFISDLGIQMDSSRGMNYYIELFQKLQALHPNLQCAQIQEH